MKPIDFKLSTYIYLGEANKGKDSKFKVCDHVRTSKYKNIFAEGGTPSLSEEVFVIKKVRNTVPWTHAIENLNGEEINKKFHGKELQNRSQTEFRTEKILKQTIHYMSSGKVLIIHSKAG